MDSTEALSSVSHINEDMYLEPEPASFDGLSQCDVGEHMAPTDEVRLSTGTHAGDTWVCDECAESIYVEAQARRNAY